LLEGGGGIREGRKKRVFTTPGLLQYWTDRKELQRGSGSGRTSLGMSEGFTREKEAREDGYSSKGSLFEEATSEERRVSKGCHREGIGEVGRKLILEAIILGGGS